MGELVELSIRPGLFTDETARGSEPYWKDCDHVRFRNNIPEKIGGWAKALDADGDTVQVQGLCRGIHDWSSLDGKSWAAIGTHLKLYLYDGETLHDITPVLKSGTLSNPFTTVSGSPLVNVADINHLIHLGDFVRFTDASNVGGLDLNNEYQVSAIISENEYQITETVNASASETGGGTVNYAYDIPIGLTDRSKVFGYGVGGYGESTYGTATAESSLFASLRIWSLDNWGEDLIASPLDGPIYHWDRTSGPTVRATLILPAPITNKRIMVSPEDRHLISFGAHTGSSEDAMLVRWSDQENFNDFFPSEINTSGDKRLDAGSRIVTAVEARGEKIVFTDEAIYAMGFIGGNDVFSFYPLSRSIRIASPNAAVQVNGVVYFMGSDDFFVFDGAVRVLPCPVRNRVFDNLNKVQINKVYAAVNQLFTEIWWVYPSTAANENDRYVVYNYREQTWYFGTIERTALHDQSSLFNVPYGIDPSGFVYKHETTVNADGAALPAFIESHDLEIMEGRRMAHINRMVPDFLVLAGEVSVTLKSRRYPQDVQQVIKGPYLVDATTRKLSVRIRNRQIAVRVDSDALGDDWRMGTWRAEVRQHGGR